MSHEPWMFFSYTGKCKAQSTLNGDKASWKLLGFYQTEGEFGLILLILNMIVSWRQNAHF